jgi:hypothetical protein
MPPGSLSGWKTVCIGTESAMKWLKMLPGVLLALALPAAVAQMGDGAPAVAMGSGRMVRGTVTAAAADHLTVKTETGAVYEVVVTPNSQVRKGRDQMKLADVHVGDAVGAMGEIDPAKKTVHALMVQVVDTEAVKKAREAMGKTFIAGTVTAIDDLKITVKRTDDVVQVIAVDEDTSFRKGARGMQMALQADGMGAGMSGARGQRGGAAPAATPDTAESLTLADIKVGSVVAGPGTIKGGVFVPATLSIGEAGAPRQRRRPDGAGAPAATPPATTTPPGTGTEPK